ncbi:MAG: hypothetical protein HYS07_03185 [Chlamydiae bacterium]|nr:hypothetical protein [Chlamydiota bacterium]MBI3276261.1 hypothetical protein [Chlamydiota bacterium]
MNSKMNKRVVVRRAFVGVLSLLWAGVLPYDSAQGGGTTGQGESQIQSSMA